MSMEFINNDLQITPGADWEAWFESLRESWPTTASQMSHNVNIAMGLKTAAVLFRMTGNNAYVQLGRRRLEDLQRLVGLPTGMFVGDEHLPMPRIRSPSRGSELCGVVEEMFSLNILFRWEYAETGQGHGQCRVCLP